MEYYIIRKLEGMKKKKDHPEEWLIWATTTKEDMNMDMMVCEGRFSFDEEKDYSCGVIKARLWTENDY